MGMTVPEIIFGIIQSRQNSELVNMQIEKQKLENQKIKKMLDLLETGNTNINATTLSPQQKDQAKVGLANLVAQNLPSSIRMGTRNVPQRQGLPQQIAQGQTGIPPGYIKAAMMKELFGLTPERSQFRGGLMGPWGGPATGRINPYSGAVQNWYPQYLEPQFQERILPDGTRVREWVQQPGTGIPQGAPGSIGGNKGFITELGPADKPIPDSDIPLYIHPDTLESPPVGLTPKQATELGFKRMTTNARNQIDATKGVISVAANIRQLMNEVFPPQGGLLERVSGGATRFMGAKLQTNPKATEFDALINGTLAPFIRALGEKGTLADNDVARAKALMPQITDSADVAWNKLDRLEKLFNEIQQSVVSGTYKKSGVTKEMNLKPGVKEIKQEDPLGLR